MSRVLPFRPRGAAAAVAADAAREGPDPALGDRLDRLAARLTVDPGDRAALRRLVGLLAPGISDLHEHHAALAPIFAAVREGAAPAPGALALLLRVAREEAAFLRTGAV